MRQRSVRTALANVRYPATPEESIGLAEQAIADAGAAGAAVVCFPKCYVPGYRGLGKAPPPPDAAFLESAWTRISVSAAKAKIAVILGTERLEGKALTFGVVICHEGWRYPETVRFAARNGAQVVFHPHLEIGGDDGYAPTTFADRANTFHEKALLCRAAENTIFIASAIYAAEGSATTSAIVNPDGTLLTFQPYGKEGLLVADLDLSLATGLLARRYRPVV